MAKYRYKALKNNTEIVDGEVEAQSLREARELIRKLGFIPTKVYCETGVQNQIVVDNAQNLSVNVKISRLKLSQKIVFTSQLETLLSAGIPIVEALQNIESSTPDLKLKTICCNTCKLIMTGSTFAQALSQLYGNVFGAVYTALVKTGEEAGELEETLRRMLVLLRKQESIQDRIKSASIYPAILILMIIGLLIVFAKFVFPKFAALMAFNGEELPCLAQSIIGLFNFIDNYWWLFLIIIGAAGYTVMSLFKNPHIKRKWDEFILKIPVVSDFITYVNLSNFMTVMYISFEAGVPIIDGLELANKTVGNSVIKSKVAHSSTLVRAGKSLSEALTNAIPSALLSMISAGEKSGMLGKMFRDCADVIDKKVDLTLEAMTKLFEPAVILILGGVVAIIAFALYQAYVSMLGSLL